MRFRPVPALVCLMCLSVALPAAAQEMPATLLQELHWRSIGPSRGGRVLAVAGVPREPDHFYFGAVNGGVWETTDAGRTWRPIFDSQPIGGRSARSPPRAGHRPSFRSATTARTPATATTTTSATAAISDQLGAQRHHRARLLVQ